MFHRHSPGGRSVEFFLSFFLYLPSNRYKSVQTEYKSGQDRKAARAALITALIKVAVSCAFIAKSDNKTIMQEKNLSVYKLSTLQY